MLIQICVECNKSIEKKNRSICKDGNFRCKPCNAVLKTRKYRNSERGRAYLKSYRKIYYTNNREECLERVKDWDKRNPEKRKKINAKVRLTPQWKSLNKLAVKRYRQTEKGKEARNRAEKVYRKNHPEVVRARRHPGIPHEIIYDLLSKPCNLCGSTENITVDHIHPVSKGGKSVSDNLQPLCNLCNAFKNNHLFLPGGGMMLSGRA